MFDLVDTIEELNKMRVACIQGGTDPVTVNNEYNKRRAEILKGSTKIREIAYSIYEAAEPMLTRGLPIVGTTGKPDVIAITTGGIYV